jgi:hypothetical protein
MKKLDDVKHGKRNFGIFLLILQVMAFYGSTLEGNSLPSEFLEMIGYLLPGIIGLLLIISDYKKSK